MKKRFEKFIFFLFILVLFSFSFFLSSAQEGSLEVDYPGFSAETSEENLLPSYIRYIFIIIIIGAGVRALMLLIQAGIIYLTSAGNPEKIKDARKKILAVFWGTILLLSSYLILNTINPQIVKLDLSPISPLIFNLPSSPPAAPPPYEDFLWRITEIANSSKMVIDEQINLAREIDFLTSKCDCENTQSLCLCQKYIGGSCEALYCYSTDNKQPCPDGSLIIQKQKELVASLRELIYYKNRADAERNDFLLQSETLKKEILAYENKIQAENEYLGKVTTIAEKNAQQQIIKDLELYLNGLKAKLKLYDELEKNLGEAILSIDRTAQAVDELSKLPNYCFSNVEKECEGSCKGGCHDKKECSPEKCEGGNPCPPEISGEAGKVNSFGNNNKSIFDQTIKIVKNIISLKR